jgi:hypothetical protein
MRPHAMREWRPGTLRDLTVTPDPDPYVQSATGFSFIPCGTRPRPCVQLYYLLVWLLVHLIMKLHDQELSFRYGP